MGKTPRHGSPRDRGSADAYYGRPMRPHYFSGATYQSKEITKLTDQIEYQSVYISDISNNVLKPLGIDENRFR